MARAATRKPKSTSPRGPSPAPTPTRSRADLAIEPSAARGTAPRVVATRLDATRRDAKRLVASAAELQVALVAAENRIAALEAAHAQLADRLSWMLDTLETLLAEEGG